MGKYDLTNQLTPVQSTFVDPGLKTFKEAAMIFRQTYDQNKDAYNLSKRVMAQMELMPGDEDAGLRDQFSGTINKTFEDIVRVGNFEDAEMAVQNAVDYITTDKTVMQARRNAAEYAKEEALIEQFGPSGILDFNKDLRSSFTTVSTNEDGTTKINSYREEMEKKEDYATFMNTLTSGISPSGQSWGKVLGNFYQYGNWEGVNKAKVERIVNGLYEAYIGDKVGEQDFRRLTQIEGMSEEGAKEDIIRRMTNIAMKQEGVVSKISGMKDLTPNSGGGGADYLTADPSHQSLLNTEGEDMGYEDWRAQVDLPDGSIDASVMIENSKGLVLDWASQFDDEERATISQGLLSSGLATTEEDAINMITPLIQFRQAQLQGDRAKSLKIAQDLGYMGDGWDDKAAKSLNAVANGISGIVGQETLDNMGALLDANVSGSFRLNMGGGNNMETIGTSFVSDGMMYFNEEQMNQIANQMGWGTVGSTFGWDIDMLPGTSVDIENKEFNGRPMFTPETIDGVDYWKIPAKHMSNFSNPKGNKRYSLLNSESSFGKYNVSLEDARNWTVNMKANLAGRRPSMNAKIDALPNVGNKVALKKMYSETAEDLMGVAHNASPNESSQGIYDLYLKALERAILTAANNGITDQAGITPYVQQEMQLVNQYLLSQQEQ